MVALSWVLECVSMSKFDRLVPAGFKTLRISNLSNVLPRLQYLSYYGLLGNLTGNVRHATPTEIASLSTSFPTLYIFRDM